MRCSEVTERLALYVGDDLDRRTTRRVAEHLRGCTACFEAAAAYREAVQFVREASEPAFEAEFFEGIRRDVLVEIRRSPSPVRTPRPAWVMPVAASLAVAALSFAIAARSGFLGGPAVDRAEVSTEAAPNASPERVDTPPSTPAPDPGPGRGAPPRHRAPRRIPPAPRGRIESEHVAKSTPVSTDDMLRIEYQTSDPNIRIIWFVPKEGSGANEPNKTGI
jgi:hypothetical protein